MKEEFDILFAEHQKLLGELQAMKALAQPEQEPQKGGCTWCGGDCPQFECDTHSTWMNEPVIRRDMPPQPKEPEQEPVSVKHMMEWVDYLKRKSDYGQHLQIPSEMSAGACWDLARELEQFIANPPQRKPLTDGQINEVLDSMKLLVPSRIARAIEAAHGIKE